jgi:hypothetical protein
LRAVGNRQGRGRMTSDTMLRRSYSPRGMVIATAEALPEGPAFESAAARSLSLNVAREGVDVGRLSELQHSRDALSHAMVGYIGWVATHYDALSKRVPLYREGLRDSLREELPDSHPRTPDTAAALITAHTTLEAYAKSVGALDEESGKEFLSRASAGVMDAARAHTDATRGGDPATRFVELLRSLFEADKAYVRDRESGKQPRGWEELGWEETDGMSGDLYQPKRSAEFVGWADETYLYLDREAGYAAVSHFAQRGGIPFGIKPRALWGALKRGGLSLADQGRNDTLARIQGKPKRVVQIRRGAIREEEAADE